MKKMGSYEEAVEKIDKVFKGPAREPYTFRVCELFNAAKQIERGVIVELGTHHGYGAFALAYGAMSGSGVAVITIDDYAHRHGWAGESYDMNDYKVFMQNMNALGFSFGDIVHIRQDITFMGEIWQGSAYDGEVSLLYIDTGTSKEHVQEITDVWKQNVAVGGIMMYRDTTNRVLGTDKICSTLIKEGDWSLVSSNKYFTNIMRVK